MAPRKHTINCYVYIVFRLDGSPCYVGKGRGRRWERHEGRCRNPHLSNILKAANGRLPKIKFKEDLSEAEAFAVERALIAEIGREANGGPLVNMTDGGEGPTGYIFTVEDRNRVAAGLKGKPKSEKHRRAVGDALKTSERAIAQRAILRESRRGIPLKSSTREAIRKTLTGRKRGPYSAAYRAAISAGKIKGWARKRAAQAAAQLLGGWTNDDRINLPGEGRREDQVDTLGRDRTVPPGSHEGSRRATRAALRARRLDGRGDRGSHRRS